MSTPVEEWYLIFSVPHNAWWRKGRSGYTVDENEAGRYTLDDALKTCALVRDGWRSPPTELPVRLVDVFRCRGIAADTMPFLNAPSPPQHSCHGSGPDG